MKKSLSLLTLLFVSSVVFAQNNVGIGTSNPRNSAILDLYSTTQGLLLPRVDTLNITGLVAADHGLMVYDTTINKILIWNGSSWESISDDNSFQLAYDGGQTVNMGSGNINFISPAANSILYLNEGNERVGIGTITPGAKLEVSTDIIISGMRIGRGPGADNRTTAIGLRSLDNNTTGAANTSVGYEAMWQNLGGSDNTAFGANSLSTNSGGFRNTAVGASALFTNTSGNDNTALGRAADVASGGLSNATALGANTIVGASNSLVLGNNANVGIGTSTPANKLEVIGDAAKFDSVIIANNAQVGYVLTAADATGAASWQQLPSSTSWNLFGNAGTVDATNFIGTTDNVPLNIRVNGFPSGKIDASGPTFYGYQSGINNSAITSTAFGYRTLSNNLTGINNTALGYAALENSSGPRNTAIGARALANNLGAEGNTAVGDRALQANTIGERNTAIGLTSMFSNVSGNENVAVGWDALFSNLGGTQNVALGYRAGFSNTSGTNNLFLGENADASVGNLSNATAIGAGAIVSASNSIVLGNNANVGIGTSTPSWNLDISGSTNAIMRLQGAGSPSFSGLLLQNDISNSVEIGLNGSTHPASPNALVINQTSNSPIRILSNNTERLRITGAGNVGIGTTTPANKLEVIGDAAKFDSVIIANNAQAGYVLTAADATGAASWQAPDTSPWSLNATDVFYTGGNVGIGTNAPSHDLEIADAAAEIYLNGSSSNSIIYRAQGIGFPLLNTRSAGTKLMLWGQFGPTSVDYAIGVGPNTMWYSVPFSNNTNQHVFYGAGSELMRIRGDGNVGIGTTNPSTKLEVNGDISLSSGANRTIVMTPEPNSADPFSLTIKGSNSTVGAAARNGGHLVMEAGHNYNISIPTSTPGHVYLRSGGNIFGPGGNSPAGDLHFQTGGLAGNPNIYDERMIIKGSGNIGIGTSAPAAKLDVIGNIKITDGTQALGRVLTSDANGLANWQVPPASPWTLNVTDLFYTAGNVGIGTNAPNAPLQFANTLVNRKIVLFDVNNNDHQYFGFGVTGSELRYQINSPASHVFYASSSATTSTELMKISSNGNVGIGTSSPLGRLHVANSDWNNGSMQVSASTSGSAGATIRFTSPDVGNHTYDLIGSTGISSSIGVGGFGIFDNTVAAYRLAIDPNGNIGIGTNTPAAKLDVSGTARVTGEAEINGIQFITTASTNPVATDQFRINSGAMANVVFYTACASPSFAAVLFFDSNGQVEIMSEAGNGGNNVSLAAPNQIRLNDSCGQNVPYVFSLSGGVITISYPLGAFTTAKWVITSI